MKKVSTKTLMVLTLMVASFASTPMMVAGYDYDNDYIFDQIGETDPTALIGGFGSIFGGMFGSLGYGGNILGSVFEMLLMQGLENFEKSQLLDGVYVLSASKEQNYTGTKTFSGQPEYYMLPYDYNQSMIESNDLGYAYCEVKRTGSYTYNLTIGAGVTLVIWDNDGSFIRAVTKLIDFYYELKTYEFNDELPPDDLIKKGVETIIWFLIHINDIFTGDELFVLNPTTWQKLEILPGVEGYNITKTWKVTKDWTIDNENDREIEVLTEMLDGVNGSALLDAWNDLAILGKNSRMEWLLRPTDDADIATTIFTTFTFDLIQLWVKTFQIHIDVGEIMNTFSNPENQVNIAKIFQGLEIDFYLFTHHLAGAFLYNDLDNSGELSAEYVPLVNSTGDPHLDNMGDPIEVPLSSELTHRLILGDVNDFNFKLPEKVPNKNKIKWGLTLDQASIIPVPIGIDLDSYLGASDELLAYIHFGFTFEPKFITMTATDGTSVPVLHGAVKLDQEFAPWNNLTNPTTNNNVTDLDLAIIYVSTVLHFHLTVKTFDEGPDITNKLNPEDDYNNETHTLKIGNYLGKSIAGKLDFVDIAGPEYTYGSTISNDTAPANTSIIPLALFEAEVERHDTFEANNGSSYTTFATDIQLNVSFNVMVYAICFPMFEDGTGIWHDPTFSVFMVFEAKGFWALILLISGVGFVGVATILIKRRKDMRF
jgi:hypothetical protein